MTRDTFLVCALSLAAAASLAAQPTPTTAEPPPHAARDAIADACGIWSEEVGLAGGGPDYSVEFTSSGARFVPALPAEAELHAIEVGLVQLRRGERTVASWGSDSKPARAGDRRVHYRHTARVTETFEVRSDGLKHAVELAARPPGDGDLVALVRVGSTLAAPPAGRCDAGLALRARPGVGVDIGRAVAVDATGRRWPMAMAWRDGLLELRLPAAAVEAAAFPLELDPLISTVFSISATAGDTEPDIACNARSGRYLVVWSRRLAATSAEVRGLIVDPSGAPLTGLLRIDANNTALSTSPTAAFVAQSGRFAVVWQEAASPFGPWDLWVRGVEGDGQRSIIVQVTQASAQDVEPALGSEVTVVDDDVVLVWTRPGEGVRGAQIQLRLNFPTVISPPMVLSDSLLVADPGAGDACISRSGGVLGRFVVAWRSSAGDVGARLFDRDLAALSPATTVTTSGLASTPAVDGDGRSFVLVYRELSLPTSLSGDVIGTPLSWNGSRLLAAAPVAIAANPTVDERTPAVAWLGTKYLIAWSREGVGFLDYDLRLRAFSPACAACGDEAVVGSAVGAYDAHPAIASEFHGGGKGDEALVVFSSVASTSLSTSLQAQRFEALGPGGPVVSLGGGCTGGGTASTIGPVAVGNPSFRYRLDGADPTAPTALFYMGLPNLTYACGSCTFVIQLITVPVPLVGGSAEVPSPISCALYNALGASVDVQWITLGGSSSPCPSLPGIAGSNRLRVTIGL